MPRRVADGQVRHMIAEDVEFRCRDDILEIDDRRVVGAHEVQSWGWPLKKGRMSFDSLRSGRPGSLRSARKSLKSALICFLLIGTGLKVGIGEIGDLSPS